ncbi:MAG: DeoR/GlpR family DNA-binding transcription regulator [Nocardioides sp.]
MVAHKPLKFARHARIQSALDSPESPGGVSVRELTELLGVSQATVRRDLEDLERSGLVRRTHGGAVLVSELPRPDRESRQVAQKRAIAAAALDLVQPGSTYFLGGGTTTLQLAGLLDDLDVTVVTNSIPIATRLADGRARVVVIGGTLRTPELSMVGPRAAEAIRAYRAEIAFLGAPALDAECGFTQDGDAEAATDTAFLEMARRAVLLVDHTKLGRVSTTYVAPLTSIDTVVTDAAADPLQVRAMTAAGTRVLVAGADR